MAGDLDLDGHVDLITTSWGGGSVSIFWNTGDGAFDRDLVATIPIDRSPFSLSVADLNGNGLLDFADVLSMFLHLDSPEVQENFPDFDFNANGAADMADVVLIFDTLLASAA